MRIRTNRILEKNRQGKKGLGLGLVYPSAEAIEIVGMLGGFDFVQLDGEHGLFPPESIDGMCRVADGIGLTVKARLPSGRCGVDPSSRTGCPSSTTGTRQGRDRRRNDHRRSKVRHHLVGRKRGHRCP